MRNARVAALLTIIAATASASEWRMHQQSASFMGTKWHIALYSRDAEAANAAFVRAFEVIGEIDKALTNYDRDSELNRLCRSSPHIAPVPVSDHLWRVLREADALSRKTNGAFDVTIGPLTKLWRRARAKKKLPEAARLKAARQAVGYHHVEFATDSQAVRLTAAGMQIDLGGIAKGYAVDQAMAEIRKCGITSALVNGGGDLAVSDAPPMTEGWGIDVAGLNPAESPNRIRLANTAIATSGDAWQFLEIDGIRYSHILDPRTGVGLTRRISVSVIADNCMQADAWASAMCVLPENATRFAKEIPSLEAMITIVDQQGEPSRQYTDGFPQSAAAE